MGRDLPGDPPCFKKGWSRRCLFMCSHWCVCPSGACALLDTFMSRPSCTWHDSRQSRARTSKLASCTPTNPNKRSCISSEAKQQRGFKILYNSIFFVGAQIVCHSEITTSCPFAQNPPTPFKPSLECYEEGKESVFCAG